MTELTEKERQWVAKHRELILEELFGQCEEHQADESFLPWLLYVRHGERGVKMCPFHPERGELIVRSVLEG